MLLVVPLEISWCDGRHQVLSCARSACASAAAIWHARSVVRANAGQLLTGSTSQMELTSLAPEQMSEGLRKVVGPGAPAALKMMAARGLAPLKPAEQVTALYQISLEPDEALKAAATKSASELADRVLTTALSEALDPRVLHFLSERLLARHGLYEALILNRALADESVVLLAASATERELEIIGVNEERILRCPAILTAMYMNRATRQSTIDRLVELCARNHVRPEGIAAFDEAVAAVAEQGPPAFDGQDFEIDRQMADAQAEAEAEQARADSEARAKGKAAALLIDEELGGGGDPEADEPAAAPVPEKKKKIRIEDLPMTAKIRLATTGNTFHRAILIRDTKKQVALAAVKSPAVTELEIAAWASNRALSEDVLRFIASSRTYTKDYSVKKALCFNPKVPVALTMGLIVHLQTPDLQKIAKSKNVPQALQATARRIYVQRTEKKK